MLLEELLSQHYHLLIAEVRGQLGQEEMD